MTDTDNHPPSCSCDVCDCECVAHCPVHVTMTRDERQRLTEEIARLRADAKVSEDEWAAWQKDNDVAEARIAELEAKCEMLSDDSVLMQEYEKKCARVNKLEAALARWDGHDCYPRDGGDL